MGDLYPCAHPSDRGAELSADRPDGGPDRSRDHAGQLAHVHAERGAHTLEALAREWADLVVGFDMLLGPMLACEAAGQTLTLLGTMISFFPLPGIAPLGPGLGLARSEAQRVAHEAARAEMEAILNVRLPTLNAARAQLGLPPLAHLADQLEAATVHCLGTARAFDFPGALLRPNMRYVGPLIGDPVWAAPWRSPWPKDDPRPLALAGFSTSFQNHVGVVQRVIDAAAALPVRLLVTLGGPILPGELKPAENTGPC